MLSGFDGVKSSDPSIFSAARNALYQRHGPAEWKQTNLSKLQASDVSRQEGELTRFDSLRTGKETYNSTEQFNNETQKKLKGRIDDVKHWKQELDAEISGMEYVVETLLKTTRATEKLLQVTEEPLHVAQECLHAREKRQGIDLVHDQAEKDLLQEIEIITECQVALKKAICDIEEQLRRNDEIQRETQKDVKDKFIALQMDERCASMKYHSPELNGHKDGSNSSNNPSDPITWLKFSQENLRVSQQARHVSMQLIDRVEHIILQSKEKMKTQWTRVNESLNLRVQETTEARNSLQHHLNKILQEIFDVSKSIDYIKKCIKEKDGPHALSETRLNTRLYRPHMEACRDSVQTHLVEQLETVKFDISKLQIQLSQSEETMRRLLDKKATLEKDLSVKNNSLYIDVEKCVALHRHIFIQ